MSNIAEIEGIGPQYASKPVSYTHLEYAEGYFALKLVIPWLAQSATKEMIDDFIEKELPLLHTLRSIMIEGAKPDEQLKKMILKLGY